MRRWKGPIALSSLREFEIPEFSGVYVLLGSERDPSKVLKIGSARSLRDAFRRELEETDANRPVRPQAFTYFEAVKDDEEAERFLKDYRRHRGERPMYNSGF